MTAPTTGNTILDALLWLAGIAVAVATGVGALRGGQRVSRDTEKARDAPLPPTWAEMWERMDRQQDQINTQQGEINGLRSDVDRLRVTEGRLVAWVMALHSGIEDGSIPPMPHIPKWLADLLSERDES